MVSIENNSKLEGGYSGSKIVPYQVKYSVEGEGPANIVVKVTNGATCGILRVAREAHFLACYGKDAFNPPETYYARGYFDKPESAYIIMQDLSQFATRMDQFHGDRGSEQNAADTPPVLSSVQAWKKSFEAIAKTHAKYWGA